MFSTFDPMEVKIVYRGMKCYLFILMFLTIFLGYGYRTNAQGWTFTIKLIQTGPCDILKIPEMPAIPASGYQTQTQCDNERRSLLNFRKGYPVYGEKGNFIGDCTFSLICTPCTGKNTDPTSQADSFIQC